MLFDNRELAIVIWAFVGVGLAFLKEKIRPSIVRVAKAFVQRKLFWLWLSMLAYLGLLIWLLATLGIWTSDLTGETVFWFFGPALVLFLRLDKATTDPRFLRRALFSILEFTVLIEFVINLYPLNLILELLLVPILFFLGGTLAVAALKAEYRQTRVFLEVLVVLVGVGFLTYAALQIVQDPAGFATVGTLREFVVPLLLTLAFVPFVYGVAVLTTYGWLFNRLNWKLDDEGLARYAKWRLVRATLFRLKAIRGFNSYPWRLTNSMDRAAVGRVIERFKSGDTGPGV